MFKKFWVGIGVLIVAVGMLGGCGDKKEATSSILDNKTKVVVDREELHRVITRPNSYKDKIVNWKYTETNDYIGRLSIQDSVNDESIKFVGVTYIKMIGADWNKVELPSVVVPVDIFRKMDSEFYNEHKKNMSDYALHINDLEIVPVKGSDLKELGSATGGMAGFIKNDAWYLIITKVDVRNMKVYKTEMNL
jgi:hypothetical protein